MIDIEIYTNICLLASIISFAIACVFYFKYKHELETSEFWQERYYSVKNQKIEIEQALKIEGDLNEK